MRLGPKVAGFATTRGTIFEKLGKREPAIVDYRAALALDPTNQLARAGLRRLGAKP